MKLTPSPPAPVRAFDAADGGVEAGRGDYFSGTVATPFGGTNANSLSSSPELIASFVNCIVTVFSNWS